MTGEPKLPPVKEAPTTSPPQVASRFGFPKQEGYSLSHWLLSVQNDPLLHHRTTPQLPASADIVIIGSGITGTSVAKHCLATWPDKSVVVVESRMFCSGATGRNAGHCKPDQYRGFREYEKTFGTEQALKILRNEYQTWSDVVRYVRENNVDCELWVGDTLDVPTTPELAAASKDSFDRLKAAGGRVDHIKVTANPAEAAKISRIADAQACYAWPASTLHPWKLAAHIMRENLKKGVNLQTGTTVVRVTPGPRSSGIWIVETNRGNIECTQVVHATNAYSSALEPSLRGLITPTPHMCNRVDPPKTFQKDKGLQNSYGVLLPDRALLTINPRCTSDGSPLFGGSNPGQLQFRKWLETHPERCTDDGVVNFEAVTQAVKDFAESELVGWADGANGSEQVYSNSWSGIIGLSADGVPFVGQVPGLPGQWVCAGHHGHGMARIFTAAPGLVKLMAGGSWESTQLPDVFQITQSRMKRLEHSTGPRL
ncbi:hypothetical protein A1O1_05705 [Capronia coronata CBS 617.96]|uniref:FAD dependent oxidoreductase domain-containing protein n=1 Tax=Capronia coronata CBS 617.96 TaxID=1182541 RepID=W9Y800_9EURO|nr:uncharacterized protein A1O1_05705 [Capronia coronata CBS 617.96]EXJ85341.1 hypothetical protein A1O1_05705 [Capronia coronata CBS 617.96]